MKLASFPVVRSAIASVGFACLAVACVAQSGDPTATSSQDLSVGHDYTCASTNACYDLDEGGGTECTAVSGCAADPQRGRGLMVLLCRQPRAPPAT